MAKRRKPAQDHLTTLLRRQLAAARKQVQQLESIPEGELRGKWWHGMYSYWRSQYELLWEAVEGSPNGTAGPPATSARPTDEGHTG